MKNDNIPTVDLDALQWDEIKRAAAESKWMPAEYCVNEWVSDVCAFLRDGPREPKLYYFNPNTYGNEWFVVAYSREKAIAAVKQHVCVNGFAANFGSNESAEERQREIEEEVADIDRYVNAIKDDWDEKPPCIEEHPIGSVIQSEIA
jgi:hypothetical protein